MAVTPPQTLDHGRYQLRARLGKGGVATVYEALDTRLRTVVAIKLLSAPGPSRALLVARLEQELKLMRGARHPNVLPLYDFRTEGELDYVVMGIATGGSLQDRLDAQGPMPIALAVGYTQQLLSALGWAHQQRVVHRDVKPQNVLLDADGVAMLADFGIALLGHADELDRHTRADIAMGSFAYMPPEQRLDARSVTAAADVYAAGSTLYALLTAGNPVDLFTAGPGSQRWGGVPSPLIEVIRRATAASVEERYPDVISFSEALSEALTAIPAALRAHPITPFRADASAGVSEHWLRATQDAVTYLGELGTGLSSGEPRGTGLGGGEAQWTGLPEREDPSDTFLALAVSREPTRVPEITHEPTDECGPPRSVTPAVTHATTSNGEIRRWGVSGLTVGALMLVGTVLVWGAASWGEGRAPLAATSDGMPSAIPSAEPLEDGTSAPLSPPAPLIGPSAAAAPASPGPSGADGVSEVAREAAVPVPTATSRVRAVAAVEAPTGDSKAEVSPSVVLASAGVPSALIETDMRAILGSSELMVDGAQWAISLRGTPERLEGSVFVPPKADGEPLPETGVLHAVRGSYDPVRRQLTLRDLENSPDALTYVVFLDKPTGPGGFRGRVETRLGALVSLEFRR